MKQLHPALICHTCVLYMIRCTPDLTIAWSRELGVSPISATPLIADIDADGRLEIVALTYAGEAHVLRASNGLSTGLSGVNTPAAGWPFSFSHGSFLSSPLQVM